MLVSPYSSPSNDSGANRAGSLAHPCVSHKHTGSPPYPGVSHPQIHSAVDRNQHSHPTAATPRTARPAVSVRAVSCMGLEHPRIWGSEGWPGTSPLWTPRGDCSYIFGESKVTGRFLTAPLILTWFKGQLYIYSANRIAHRRLFEEAVEREEDALVPCGSCDRYRGLGGFEPCQMGPEPELKVPAASRPSEGARPRPVGGRLSPCPLTGPSLSVRLCLGYPFLWGHHSDWIGAHPDNLILTRSPLRRPFPI